MAPQVGVVVVVNSTQGLLFGGLVILFGLLWSNNQCAWCGPLMPPPQPLINKYLSTPNLQFRNPNPFLPPPPRNNTVSRSPPLLVCPTKFGPRDTPPSQLISLLQPPPRHPHTATHFAIRPRLRRACNLMLNSTPSRIFQHSIFASR